MVKFNNKTRPKKRRQKKIDTISALYEGGELTLNALKSRIFLIKATKGKGLKLLPPK